MDLLDHLLDLQKLDKINTLDQYIGIYIIGIYIIGIYISLGYIIGIHWIMFFGKNMDHILDHHVCNLQTGIPFSCHSLTMDILNPLSYLCTERAVGHCMHFIM